MVKGKFGKISEKGQNIMKLIADYEKAKLWHFAKNLRKLLTEVWKDKKNKENMIESLC